MIAEKNPVLSKAVVRLAELSQDERARMLYESRQMLEWDIAIEKREAIREARQEARYDAIREASISIAKNLLAMNLPTESIIAATGLTYEEVEDLQRGCLA